MAWIWRRYNGGPGVVIAPRYTVLTTDMVHMLCFHGADLAAYDEPLPDMNRADIQTYVRERITQRGQSAMEDVWSDDLTSDQYTAVETWARAQIATAFPDQA